MTYTKIEIKSSELQVGDVFRVIKSVGNLSDVFEYEVTKPVTVQHKPHPKFPDLILVDVTIKVKNRRNGQSKTLNYTDTNQTVWRKS